MLGAGGLLGACYGRSHRCRLLLLPQSCNVPKEIVEVKIPATVFRLGRVRSFTFPGHSAPSSYTADKYVCSTEKKVASGVIVTKVLDDR